MSAGFDWRIGPAKKVLAVLTEARREARKLLRAVLGKGALIYAWWESGVKMAKLLQRGGRERLRRTLPSDNRVFKPTMSALERTHISSACISAGQVAGLNLVSPTPLGRDT